MNIALSSIVQVFSAATIAFFVSIFLTPAFTLFLYKNKLGKQIRKTTVDGRKAELFRKLHIHKTGTPTMGGILIWGITTLLSIPLIFTITADSPQRGFLWIPLFTLVACGILGAVDDYLNTRNIGKHGGISAKIKLFWLTLFASIGAFWFYFKLDYQEIGIPFYGQLHLGWLFIPLFIFVIIGTANAVNITDGLDGLAGGLLVIAFGSFAIISYNHELVPLTIFISIIIGCLLSFLWFNIPPARFYMGDTGALALGATLGVIAFLTDSVLILPLIGSIFVIETLSCIIQLTSKRFLGHKIFKIAPIHHHFEALGWPEYKVTMRFWVLGAVFAIIGLLIHLI